MGDDANRAAPVLLHVASRAHLPLDEVTLAKALSAANYSTALVGERERERMRTEEREREKENRRTVKRKQKEKRT